MQWLALSIGLLLIPVALSDTAQETTPTVQTDDGGTGTPPTKP